MQPLSESLNRQIVALAPAYVVCNDAPNTWKELQRNAYDSRGRIRIYGGGSDHTIYGVNKVNYAFRAWHDNLHLQHNLSFKPDDEIKLAQIHADMITGDYEKQLIHADIAGQVKHWQKFNAFVDNQYRFVLNYLLTSEVIRA